LPCNVANTPIAVASATAPIAGATRTNPSGRVRRAGGAPACARAESARAAPRSRARAHRPAPVPRHDRRGRPREEDIGFSRTLSRSRSWRRPCGFSRSTRHDAVSSARLKRAWSSCTRPNSDSRSLLVVNAVPIPFAISRDHELAPCRVE
jgi:hypothetical protein